MIASRLGETAALLTALCWTICAIAFEVASKRAGALAVNMIRLAIGLIMLTLFCLFTREAILPLDASMRTWFWLSMSGMIGFAVGDLLLLRAFIVIGSRVSMLVMASVPPLTALIGWAIIGETLGTMGLLGMTLTVGGIALVVLERKIEEDRVRLSHSLTGILLAFGGAVGQAVGLVLSKYGMGDYNAFSATQIRILAGTVTSFPILVILGRVRHVRSVVRQRRIMIPASLGALFGPFLGVSFSLLAVQHTSTGVASTIMAIVPVLIIPPAVIFFKERITFREVVGAVIAVTGVGILFL